MKGIGHTMATTLKSKQIQSKFEKSSRDGLASDGDADQL